MRYLAFLLVIGLASCVAPANVGHFAIQEAEKKEERLWDDFIHKGTLQITRFKEGKVDGYGSGFAIAGEKTDQGHFSYVVTCYHVIKDDPTPLVTMKTPLGRRMWWSTVFRIDKKNDTAILTIFGAPAPIFDVWDKGEFKDGDHVLSAGFPRTYSGVDISWGRIRKACEDIANDIKCMINYTATGEKGCSGGPVIHFKTKKVIGITARGISGKTNRMWAINIKHAKKLLEDGGIELGG